jgi:lycopene cyclase domain-containing protein
MSHLSYLAVIAAVLICAFGVNLGFRLRISKRWRELLLTEIAILVAYLSWDTWAIAKKSWFFDPHQILNFDLLPKVPVEEVLFFITVPLMVILSYQALLKLTGWSQEDPASPVGSDR